MSGVDSVSHFPGVIILPRSPLCPLDQSVTPPTEQRGVILTVGGKTAREMTKEN